MDALNYLEAVQGGVTSDCETVQIPTTILNETIKKIHSDAAEIAYLRTCIMSEEQVQATMTETCQTLMSAQKRIFEINGALEALTKAESMIEDGSSLIALAKLCFMYKKEIKDGLESEG